MPLERWVTVYDAGPALKQRLVYVSCLMFHQEVDVPASGPSLYVRM